MFKFKKMLSFITVICLMISLSSVSYADINIIDNQNKSIVESLLISAVNDGDISNGNFTLSEEIPTYTIEDYKLKEFDEVKYHIVYCNNNPIGIITINKVGSQEATYSFSEDFIKELDKKVLSKNLEYFLVVTENKVFAVTKNDTIELIKYDIPYQSDNSVFLKGVNDYSNIEVSNMVKGLSLKTTNRNNITKLATIPEKRYIGEVSGTVPQYTQPQGSNYCWAASAWCVGETLNPLGKTVEECVKAVGGSWGEGGGVDKQKRILTEIYGLSSPKLYDALDEMSMKTLIDRDEPFIMLCFKDKDTRKLGHSVTCYKYDDAYSPIKLKVMDSLTPGNWRWMTSPKLGTDYKITCGSTTYTYTYALTPSEL